MKDGGIIKLLVILCILVSGLFFNTSIDNSSFAELSTDTDIATSNTLSQEQAKELLIKYNPNLEYIYQGDENKFDALKSKNLKGYVFLPNIETDIGYFVDKKTSDIYFFHPSGYLELIKNN